MMVSRQNLSGRAPSGGILGRVYKGPSGPGKITPPGMETSALNRGRRVMDGRDSGPVNADGVAVPDVGEMGSRPGTTPPPQSQRQGGLSGMVQDAIQQKQEALTAQNASPVLDPTRLGAQPEAGGNVTTGIPRRRGSAASRRINR